MSPYLDGVLSKDKCEELENHLQGCHLCRDELEALRRTVNLLQLWSEEELELPPGFAESLQQRLREIKPPWYRRLPKSGLSLTAAAAILLLVAFSVYGNNFDLFSMASRQQLHSPSTTQIAAADEAAPEAMVSTSERAKIMLMDEGTPAPATETATAENAATDVRMFMAEVQAETDLPAGTGAETEQPISNGYDRAISPNGTLSSRKEGKVFSEVEQLGDGQGSPEEILSTAIEPPGEHEEGAQGIGQSDTPDASKANGQEIASAKEKTGATGEAAEPEDEFQELILIWGKDKVAPEVAAWAAQNVKATGVFKKDFGCQVAYLVALGKKPVKGYEVKFKSANLDEKNIMIIELELVEPDPAGPAVKEANYPYEVFTVPDQITVIVKAVKQDSLEELPIQEPPPDN